VGIRRIDNFSSAVILGHLDHFEPGSKPELAFYGLGADGTHLAVLDGHLAGRETYNTALGLVVVRESLDGRAYFDRVPNDSSLRTEQGGRSMWLSDHRGEIASGILVVNAGNAAMNGAEIMPIEPSATLAAFGMSEAYANAPAAAAAAEQAQEDVGAKIIPLHRVAA
jgi:hypothetical protein